MPGAAQDARDELVLKNKKKVKKKKKKKLFPMFNIVLFHHRKVKNDFTHFFYFGFRLKREQS
jgi:hypothetical protein